MIRLFVAIPLPEIVRLRLVGLCTGVPGARWTQPENLHLTLRFIGEVSETSFSDIAEALSLVDGQAFDFHLAGAGQFGDRRRARILWAGIAPNDHLLRLRNQIEGHLQHAGIEPEGRKYSPHVTLARLKNAPMERVARFLGEHGQLNTTPIAAHRFVLFSSHLGQAGAIHTPEVEYPLAGVAS